MDRAVSRRRDQVPSTNLTRHIMDERIQRLTATKARAVLVGNTAELNPDRCCPNCGAMLNAA